MIGLANALVDAGLLDAREVLEEAVEFRETAGRNAGVLVTRHGRGGYFVKRSPAREREAAVYARVAAMPGVGGAVPRVATSAVAGRLILHVAPGAVDLYDLHGGGGAVDDAIGRAVGRALGALHRESRVPPSPAPERAPDVLLVHRPTSAGLAGLRPATLKLAEIITEEPGLAAALEALSESWRLEALIHGDVKWVNIIVIPGDGGRRRRVELIDWEEAAEGECAWDVGSALAAYVAAWIDSMPGRAPDRRESELAALAGRPLHRMHDGMAALWDAYLEASGVRARDVPRLRSRTASFAAARLVRTAFEETQARSRVSRRVLRLLQVAANALEDPDGAATRLLGLPE